MIKKAIINRSLDCFMKHFPYTKVNRGEQELTYTMPIQFCQYVEKEANDLIEEKKLPLIAESNLRHGILFNSVTIKSKY